MIVKQSLLPEEIGFLRDESSLFVFDFRITGDRLGVDIPFMWKYENLLPWILKDKFVAVNEDYLDLDYFQNNKFLMAPKGVAAKKSIFDRLKKIDIPSNVTKLWVAVPHPNADCLAKEKNLEINFKYADYKKLNDKLRQKELLDELTPNWFEIEDKRDLAFFTAQKGFIKNSQGAGGCTVFKASDVLKDDEFKYLYALKSSDWFWEEFTKGDPCSIQCVKEKNKITVFGYSKQLIENDSEYHGSEIYPLSKLSDEIFNQLKTVIKRLGPLLKDYQGFFGIDFMLTPNNKVYVLEANIRTTSVTVPTLLFNSTGAKKAVFKEDNEGKKYKKAIVLAQTKDHNARNILELED